MAFRGGSTRIPATNDGALERIREAVIVGIIAILMGIAVYACIGFAWTFKIAVETAQKFRPPVR